MKQELNKCQEKMNKSLGAFADELATIRAGRANPHVLDRLTVDYYGVATPVQQVGNITVPEARVLQIQPWEGTLLKAIEKAINESDLGINPTNDGKVIRLVFPELTEERRKDLTKDIKKKGENSKIAIRNIRRDALETFKKMEKANEMTKDEVEVAEKEVQKLTDKFVGEIDALVDKKSKEILSV
ncbi:ribosome recycling factor [Cellulosilyticum sp. ST5]|uniref:Ribosome-recycling factor n=1 Tax=Cellulosilyticum lentocellum (strain ATCC 49066 / DSM 5427 / NCIMB 11756 / RHM5) TaxID=642492 RepID=F2JGN8_CELLD|nr:MULTISPECIES: ribosome recycling factor [Cellulosilyticum]ADZ84130.1 ribosome recycling factor [Cellulosilyticum lentocellum DSM 5427]QEH69577.1 ribosome recycling factor [Cellulosilyticum sp. WCF-2]